MYTCKLPLLVSHFYPPLVHYVSIKYVLSFFSHLMPGLPSGYFSVTGLGIDGRNISKWIVEKVWSEFKWLMIGFSGVFIKSSGCIKGGRLSDQLNECQLLEMYSAPCSRKECTILHPLINLCKFCLKFVFICSVFRNSTRVVETLVYSTRI
jgi:hypothetical protein